MSYYSESSMLPLALRLVVTVVLWPCLWLGASAAGTTDGSTGICRGPLPKTHFSPDPKHRSGPSSGTRFLFVVGLEGSGHHAVASMMAACHASSGLCAPATTSNPDNTLIKYRYGCASLMMILWAPWALYWAVEGALNFPSGGDRELAFDIGLPCMDVTCDALYTLPACLHSQQTDSCAEVGESNFLL